MSLPSTVIVNVVFVAFYALLLAPTIFNLVRHRLGRQGTFAFVLIFCLSKLIGNALLIAAFKDNYSNKNTLEAGLILQGLGYAFIFSAALGLYTSATTDPSSSTSSSKSGIFALRDILRNNQSGKPLKSHLSTILNLINTVALILLIVGYINSSDLFQIPAVANAKLDSLAKVGDILFLIITVALTVMTVTSLIEGAHQTEHTRPILLFTMVALPFMIVRAAFVTWQAFQVNPFGQNLALRAVLQYGAEAVVNSIFTMLGLLLLRRPALSRDVENADASTEK